LFRELNISSFMAKSKNRRGSPEAIEKRKAARLFNDVLGGRGGASNKLDGRTEKRRQRLLKELEGGTGRGSKELKPLDVLQHVHELLELGETLGSIRKVSRIRKMPTMGEGVVEVVQRLHKAYGFRPEAYRFVGLDDDVLKTAGVLTGESRRARSPKKTART
jgi:hypothetical protein